MRYEFIKRAVINGAGYAFAVYCLYLSLSVTVMVFIGVFIISVLDKKHMRMIMEKRMRDCFERFLEILSSYVTIPGNFMHVFSNALSEYNKVYPADIMNDIFNRICVKCSANIPSQQILEDFAKDLNIQECYLFCDSLIICENKGGDLSRTIRETIAFIKEKTGIEHEIEMITAEKKIERLIISICPFGILALLHAIGTGYLDVLYEGLLGRAIMSIAGILFLVSSHAAKKILQVQL